MTEETMRAFIGSLELPIDAKNQLIAMNPSTYVGAATKLATQELSQK
jgi:hypothetical protein